MTDLFQPVDTKPCPPLDCASLAAAFRAICALYPDRIALSAAAVLSEVDESSAMLSMSYAELLHAAEAVASTLAGLSLPAHALVAVCLERSAGLVVAMLGVILAGHSYLPLDPAYPEARLRATLAEAAPAAMLTTEALAASLSSTPMHRLAMRGIHLVQAHGADTHKAAEPRSATIDDPDALAYVLYTSGSTGKPKGVMVSHRNVLRLFRQTEPWFRFSPDDVWTMFHSFAFDFSVWEMWGPLLTGGRLVLVPFTTSRDPEAFCALLSRERVTILNQTPTAFRLLDEADRQSTAPLALRLIIFGGEALVLRSLLPWIERHGDGSPQLVNMYGITETTVHVTYRRITRADAEHETDSLIGEPIPDLHLHLLDEQLQPVPEDTPAELYVGGAGVALGYLGQPGLTAERFVADPSAPSARLYRTGDLARRRPDGELVYLGRADRQVKINGFRIELGEVEATLLRCPTVLRLAVGLHPDLSGGGPRLAAWFTLREGADPASLAQYSAGHLPMHMRPSLYHPVEQLPLTLNGKLDLAALPLPLPSPTASPSNPGTSIAETVAEAWQHVLGRAGLSSQENFFDVGGTSVQLIALRTRLQTQLNRILPITWFFQYTTIDTLARKLAEPAVPAAPVSTPARGPAAQRTAWLAAQAKRRQAR